MPKFSSGHVRPPLVHGRFRGGKLTLPIKESVIDDAPAFLRRALVRLSADQGSRVMPDADHSPTGLIHIAASRI
jgi:hypothetical protein